MAHRFQDTPFSEYWSTLRIPSSGWVSEMLTEKLAQSVVRDAMTIRFEQSNKRDRWIHKCIMTMLGAIEALKV